MKVHVKTKNNARVLAGVWCIRRGFLFAHDKLIPLAQTNTFPFARAWRMQFVRKDLAVLKRILNHLSISIVIETPAVLPVHSHPAHLHRAWMMSAGETTTVPFAIQEYSSHSHEAVERTGGPGRCRHQCRFCGSAHCCSSRHRVLPKSSSRNCIT